MLHVTTQVGKPGKQDRERRHFSQEYNKASEPVYQETGRRYIPHYYGKSPDWKPHVSNQQPNYTNPGPDWSSRLRWIPHPQNPDYPAEEIWPENWHSIRAFPWTYRTTANEQKQWTGEMRHGKRCNFGGVHQATTQTADELQQFTTKRSNTETEMRNGLLQAAPGDKIYQAVEYSNQFHIFGSTRPIPNFSGDNRRPVDTFIPLVKLPAIPREPYSSVERRRKQEEEVKVVEGLEVWKPATPIQNMT